jgi:hypothetical protein
MGTITRVCDNCEPCNSIRNFVLLALRHVEAGLTFRLQSLSSWHSIENWVKQKSTYASGFMQ